MDDRQERVRTRAHEIWVSEGRPEGREADHWAQAEREIFSDGEAEATGEIQKRRRNKAALDLKDIDPDSNRIESQSNLDQQSTAKPKRARAGNRKT